MPREFIYGTLGFLALCIVFGAGSGWLASRWAKDEFGSNGDRKTRRYTGVHRP